MRHNMWLLDIAKKENFLILLFLKREDLLVPDELTTIGVVARLRNVFQRCRDVLLKRFEVEVLK